MGGVSWGEGGNLVIFYYLCASEIWPDKRVSFRRKGLIRGRLLYMYFKLYWPSLPVVTVVLLSIFKSFLLQVTLHASSKMHDNTFSKVLACPMKFFDTTPIGRIINRFAADMDESKFLLANILRLLIVLYFKDENYDMAVSCIGGRSLSTGENHRHITIYWLTLLHNVV